MHQTIEMWKPRAILFLTFTFLLAGCMWRNPGAWKDQRVNQQHDASPTATFVPIAETPTPDQDIDAGIEEDLQSLDGELSSLDDELRSLGVDAEKEGW